MNVLIPRLLDYRSSSGSTLLFFENNSARLIVVIAMRMCYLCLVPRGGRGLLVFGSCEEPARIILVP